MRRLIVLASEQVWPNLYSIEWLLAQPGGLREILILHTDDERRSAAPARRLTRFLKQTHPEVLVRSEEVQAEPPRIYARARAAVRQIAGTDEWFVNFSGGNKLTTLGLSALVGLAGVRLIYRELTGHWFELIADDVARFAVRPLEIDESCVNRLPLEALLQLHADWPDEVRWESRPVRSLPLLDLFRAAVAHRLNWKEAFEACGLDTFDSAAGALFEEVIAALVAAFRPSRLFRNVKAVTPTGLVLTELDVVAHEAGVIYYFDCKLRANGGGGAKSLATQIRDAAQVLEQVGGKGARGVLVRPNAEFDEAQHHFANSLNLVVIDRPELPRLVERIAKVVQKRIPNELMPLHEFLSRQRFAPASVSEPDDNDRALQEGEVTAGVFDAHRWLGRFLQSHQRTWYAVWVSPQILSIRALHSGKIDKATLRSRLEQFWRSRASIGGIRISNSGRSSIVDLSVSPPARRDIETLLANAPPDVDWANYGAKRAVVVQRRILTHAGAAHADDVVSVALVLASDPAVCRIDRLPFVPADALEDSSVYVLDIGGRHDPDKRNFDHHQLPPEPPRCTVSLVLAHLGLEADARRFWPWLEPFENNDVLGPRTTGKRLGLPDALEVDALASPVEEAMISAFAAVSTLVAGDSLFETLLLMGTRLLGDLRACIRAVETLRGEARRVWLSDQWPILWCGDTRDIPPTAFKRAVALLRREYFPDVRGMVSSDLRGGGWTLTRFDGGEEMDFRRIKDDPRLGFCHGTGYLAVTRDPLPESEVIALLRRAAGLP